MKTTCCIATVFLLFTAFASIASAEAAETYTATAVGTRGGLGGETIPVTIRITRYTDVEDLEKLASLRGEGQNALRRELEDWNAGRIGPDGQVGLDIAIARRTPAGNGHKVTLVIPRNFSFFELRDSQITRGYPFSWVELELDGEGRGQGRVVIAGKLKLDEQGRMSVEPYEIEAIRLLNVRRR